MNKIISWQQKSHLNKIPLSSEQSLQAEAFTRPLIFSWNLLHVGYKIYIYLHLNSKLWTKGLWDSAKPLLNCLWSSGVVDQARFGTAGHKLSCPHCTTCIWFSRDAGARSNPRARSLLTHQAPCAWRKAPTGGSYLLSKSLLLSWDDAGGMSHPLLNFSFGLHYQTYPHQFLSYNFLFFFIFSNLYIFQKGGNFWSVIVCMLGPVPYPLSSCIVDWC